MSAPAHPAADAVLEWGERHRRPLPWRDTRDPWAVLVSEVMSQQTQLERVVPRWHEFMRRWPTAAAMAGSDLADVLVAWQGMGYPRRARALHAAARRVVAEHGGVMPADIDALLDLPGIGPYTARAVLAFAFEADVAVLDTNVGRILARHDGERLTPRVAQQRADELVPPGRAWEWNQSMLDLGAMLCRPVPHCTECPLEPTCSWRGASDTADPAAGSAAVSRRQARFEGSLRQARGRVMAELSSTAHPTPRPAVTLGRIGDVVGADHDLEQVVASLVADGLVERHPDGTVTLASSS